MKAVEEGLDGLIVSNHGGRNMDSSVATLDVLPQIVEAVGDRCTVILDSGVRRGSDIAKAVALGAKAVLTGRATLYGTAVGGAAGAGKAIGIIRSELDKTMAYTGCRTVDEISTDIFFGERGANRWRARRGGRNDARWYVSAPTRYFGLVIAWPTAIPAPNIIAPVARVDTVHADHHACEPGRRWAARADGLLELVRIACVPFRSQTMRIVGVCARYVR